MATIVTKAADAAIAVCRLTGAGHEVVEVNITEQFITISVKDPVVCIEPNGHGEVTYVIRELRSLEAVGRFITARE